jgi:hypothetical protein
MRPLKRAQVAGLIQKLAQLCEFCKWLFNNHLVQDQSMPANNDAI